MTVYLDASVLVPLFYEEASTARIVGYIRRPGTFVVISDLAAAEFASTLARLVRVGDLAPTDARELFAQFDIWTGQNADRVEIFSADLRLAESFIRRLDLPLRTPDAAHIAAAMRLGAELASFDVQQARSAVALGCLLAEL